MTIHSTFTPSEAGSLAIEQRFESYVLRGRTEREWLVDVTYRIAADGSVVIVTAAISDETYPVTGSELDGLQEEAEAHAADVLDDLGEDPVWRMANFAVNAGLCEGFGA